MSENEEMDEGMPEFCDFLIRQIEESGEVAQTMADLIKSARGYENLRSWDEEVLRGFIEDALEVIAKDCDEKTGVAKVVELRKGEEIVFKATGDCTWADLESGEHEMEAKLKKAETELRDLDKALELIEPIMRDHPGMTV